MRPIYYVRDWPQHFDCAESRKVKRLTWIKLPIRLDDVNFIRLISGKHGASRFGVWCVLLELCGGASPRGVLIGPGKVAWNRGDLCTLTRVHHKSMEDALSALVAMDWIRIAEPGSEAAVRIASGRHPDAIRTPSGLDETRRDEDEKREERPEDAVAFSLGSARNGGLRPLAVGHSLEWDGCVSILSSLRLDPKAMMRVRGSPLDDCSLYRLLKDAKGPQVNNPSAYVMATLAKMER